MECWSLWFLQEKETAFTLPEKSNDGKEKGKRRKRRKERTEPGSSNPNDSSKFTRLKLLAPVRLMLLSANVAVLCGKALSLLSEGKNK